MRKATITVAICTYDRSHWLEACLGSLSHELKTHETVDVLVVDNAVKASTKRVVDRFLERMPGLRYVEESRTGLSFARNRALSETEGEWIAFLDDDARVLPGYLDRLLALVEDGRFDVVGGIYLPWYAEGRERWFRDAYASNAGISDELGVLSSDAFVSGGVMLLRRATALAVGGFDPGLGMGGRTLAYGEETLLQIQIRHAGGLVGVDPAWQIEHLAPRSKQRVGWLLGRAWATGRDSWRVFDRAPDVAALFGVVRRLISRPTWSLFNELRGRNGRRHWQTMLVSTACPFVQTVGELSSGIREILRRE